MIDLPTRPAPLSATPYFIDKGGILKGGLGASDDRFNRLGSRFGLSVTLPPMKYAKVGRIWVSRLISAQQEGGRMRWPLQGFDPGIPGSIIVDGSGQAGSTLNVTGANPGFAIREGHPFSIVTGGAHHIYFAKAEVVADGSGDAAVPLTVPIRVQHLGGDACHFADPMIEGLVQGDQRQWDFALANYTGIAFEIQERK